MALHVNKTFFQIYPPRKHQILSPLQIRLVVYLVLLISLTSPPWTHGRSTGEVTTTPEPNISNTQTTPEQIPSGVSQFILDMYEALNLNNEAPVSPGNTFYSRFVGPEQMKLVHLADTVRSFYPLSTFVYIYSYLLALCAQVLLINFIICTNCWYRLHEIR